MNIGEKEEDMPVEYPIPADPAQAPKREDVPIAVPEPEKVGARLAWDDVWGLVGPGADDYGDE